MGLMLAEPGFHTRCFVEWEEYPRSVIIAAQRAGYFAPAPIWDDLTTFNARPFAGAIDTLLAGYPCQPFSAAGQRRGEDDERHLWPHVARVARELGDGLRWIFLENVSGHVSLGLDSVLRELWDMGFTPAAGLFTASETGAPHKRERVFVVAYRDSEQRCADSGKPDTEANRRNDAARCGPDLGNAPRDGQREGRAEPEFRSGRNTPAQPGGALADAERHAGHQGRHGNRDRAAGGAGQADSPSTPRAALFPPPPGDASAWADTLATAPHLAPAAGLGDCFTQAARLAASPARQGQAQAQSVVCRMAHGLALRSRALRLLGNGVVPLAAGYAWRTLSNAHGLRPADLEAPSAESPGPRAIDDV